MFTTVVKLQQHSKYSSKLSIHRHDEINKGKQDRKKEVRDQIDQEKEPPKGPSANRQRQNPHFYMLNDKDSRAACDDKKYRGDQHQCKIVAEDPFPGAVIANAPNVV